MKQLGASSSGEPCPKSQKDREVTGTQKESCRYKGEPSKECLPWTAAVTKLARQGELGNKNPRPAFLLLSDHLPTPPFI